MLQCAFAPHVHFRQIIESMKELVSQVIFCCNRNEVIIFGCNASNMCVAYVWMSATSCKRYTCPEQPVIFAVGLFELVAAMKASKKKLNNTIVLTLATESEESEDAIGVQAASASVVASGDSPHSPNGSDDYTNNNDDSNECNSGSTSSGGGGAMKPSSRKPMQEHYDDDDDNDNENRRDSKEQNNGATTGLATTRPAPRLDETASGIILDFVNDATGEKTIPSVAVPVLPKIPACNIEQLPVLSAASTCEMPSHELKRMCIEATIVGTIVEIGLCKSHVTLHTKGGQDSMGWFRGRHTSPGDPAYEEANVHAPCPRANLDDLTIRMQPNHPPLMRQPFVLRFLNFFTKPSQLTPRVTIGMTPEQPLIVQYKITNVGLITYYLGQRQSIAPAILPLLRA